MPYLSGIAGRWIDYSHDERWVTYTTVPDDTLWRSQPDGSERVQLTSAPLRVYQARWSPDGTRVAFNGRRPAETSKVYVMSVSPSGGGVPECITSAPFSEGDPSWSPDGNSLLFARSVPRGATAQPGLYVMDWKTRKTESLPAPEALLRPAWSPDPRYIAATNWTGSQILLFDFHTRQWTLLATGVGLSLLVGGVEQPIFRVRIANRKAERLMGLRQILQSNVTLYGLSGLAPDDAPIATVMRINSDPYALDVDLP